VILGTLLGSEECPSPDSLAFASVVPQVRHSVLQLARRHLGLEPVEVTADTAGISIEYDYPHEVGADRLANAVGAAELGPLPAIVVDFGTATTFDVISGSGAYMGGAISPGVGTAAAELFKKAEKLNPVDLEFPRKALGTSTSQAIRAGVLMGAAGAADHIIGKLIEELGREPALWATGGWAPGIAGRCSSRLTVCPELTLVGIDRIGERCTHEG
jgi:type III pantothenate kinase